MVSYHLNGRTNNIFELHISLPQTLDCLSKKIINSKTLKEFFRDSVIKINLCFYIKSLSRKISNKIEGINLKKNREKRKEMIVVTIFFNRPSMVSLILS